MFHVERPTELSGDLLAGRPYVIAAPTSKLVGRTIKIM